MSAGLLFHPRIIVLLVTTVAAIIIFSTVKFFDDESLVYSSRRLQISQMINRLSGGHGRHHKRGAHHANNFGNASKGIYVIPVSNVILEVPPPWGGLEMPKKSYFGGFEAPADALRWNQALMQASRGEQLLLSKVLKVIRSPFDLHEGDNSFKWIHRVVELHKSKDTNWLNDIERSNSKHLKDKAPIVMLGYRKYDRAGRWKRSF